jgi:cytochrome c-type biogenesis protein CcmH
VTMRWLRVAIGLMLSPPFSLREKVSRIARRMRAAPARGERAARTNPHPHPSPHRALGRPPVSRRALGEGKRTPTTQSHVAPALRRKLLLLLALLACLTGPALAVQPDEVTKDPALETRARALSAELRCLVCQNQSIDDSDAPLARDIRILIRERIGKGESNDAVRAYLVSRYGDFILLKPPFKPETLLLWLSPVLTLGLGVAAALYARRRAPRATAALSAEEEARLAALTSNDAR